MDKNFRLFLFSSACSLLGIEIFQLAIPLTTIALGYSAIETGWCTFAFFLPVILVKIFAAPIIENSNKKATLAMSEVGRIICIISFITTLYLLNFQNLFYIIFISFIFGVFTTFTEITEPTALKLLIANKNSNSILTKYEIRTRVVQLTAPSLCGFLITYSIYSPYFTMLLISFITLFFISGIKFNNKSQKNKKYNNFFESIIDAFTWIKNNKLFTIMLLLTSINNLLHPILYLTIIFSLKSMNIGYDITGYILSGLGVGGIIGGMIAGPLSLHFNLRNLVLGINILRILVFAGFIFFPTPIGYFTFFMMKAILGGVWNVCYNIYSINEIPYDYIARVSALSGILIKVCTALGGIMAGYLINYYSIEFCLYILLALTVIMFICTIPFKKVYTSRILVTDPPK
ncbi:MFS transporter [Fluviispira multicolorata]|uniref:MFS transporter n=1 Tax=Fluviispira multicolorata TaxID=2654512 RepID=A0A833JBC6_9BACT|nr:MFS transporter [Fluviispira multicolorata]KAB8029192.1 MFS transporter [Fluviispira multicolorata]